MSALAVQPRRGARRRRERRMTIVRAVVAALMTVMFMGPILWMVSTAFKVGNQAFSATPTFFFSPTFDYIQMPSPSAFRSMDHYASTRLHETVHWSGHASRLGRTFGKRFGDKAYAFEELKKNNYEQIAREAAN